MCRDIVDWATPEDVGPYIFDWGDVLSAVIRNGHRLADRDVGMTRYRSSRPRHGLGTVAKLCGKFLASAASWIEADGQSQGEQSDAFTRSSSARRTNLAMMARVLLAPGQGSANRSS